LGLLIQKENEKTKNTIHLVFPDSLKDKNVEELFNISL